MTFEEALAAYNNALVEAHRALMDVHKTLEAEGVPVSVDWHRARLSDAGDMAGLLLSVAEHRRPRGPGVRVRWTGHWDLGKERGGELLRRTEHQAVVLLCGSEVRFRTTDGRSVARAERKAIHEEDMRIVRALPVGENAVSKAYTAMVKR